MFGRNQKKEIPYDTRQLILKDLSAAYDSALENKSKGNIKKFEIIDKSKKDTKQIFHINKKAITKDLKIFQKRNIGKSSLSP